jgi:hypothetical protein
VTKSLVLLMLLNEAYFATTQYLPINVNNLLLVNSWTIRGPSIITHQLDLHYQYVLLRVEGKLGRS